jgi:NADH dehydrogenase
MSSLVTIIGGSGFVGRYVAQRFAREGWRVRVAVRRPNEALFVKPYGSVGQVEPLPCNIRDDASLQAVIAGATAVVNCVGILSEDGRNTFADTQEHGAGRVARLATAAGVSRLVQISAIGADAASDSVYAATKGAGEIAVRDSFPDATILRPSIIFGAEDQFFNRFAAMARLGPVLPVVGGETRFQPVYVGDVAQAAFRAVDDGRTGTFELGGPDVATFRALMQKMLAVIQRRRLIVNVPFPVASAMGFGLDMVQAISLGLIHNGMITRDQVRNLRRDNVVSSDARTLADLGIAATDMDAVLPEYLWRYRPSGQFAAIKDSAKKLKRQ